MDKFNLNELLIIAIMGAIGLAIKPIVTPLVHIISSPLMIPGGSIAGGIYMSWIVLAKLLVPKKGSALLAAATQALVVLFLGYFGNHGVFSIISYGLPGLAVELIALLYNKRNIFAAIIYCIAANMVGALLIALVIFRMPTIPLLISLSAALVSAVLGGLLAWGIFIEIKKLKIIKVV
ncbi:MAG TPA: ECF transporter S component [Candidatus Cloacimonadota bacterium]|jgi:ABC-type thiamin/hydroxymethylpyrimidine transport system permease subunit|nr:ECF transporter S component [Candidatus Cloacimonadales bacterium]HPY97106.1 ECF transporter S component [Candidatus Cloacimonadota bacterium]HQB41133.1 ECF transporter S component [Candidatus Cloacimonadota bacterium]